MADFFTGEALSFQFRKNGFDPEMRNGIVVWSTDDVAPPYLHRRVESKTRPAAEDVAGEEP